MLNVALVVLALVGSPPIIELPSPTAVQRGTTAEIRIEGKQLGNTTRALFSPAEAISAEIASKAPGMVVLRITTSPATPLGPCELRLATPDGVSNAVILHVVIDPVIHAKNPDQSGAAPHRIAIPSVISGVITRGGETDRLRFAARAKQPLVFEIHAVRGGSMLEPAVTVEDARGRTVAWEDNRPDGDALVRLDPPVDGDYDLVIRDLRYRGGKGFHYRIVARGGSPPNPTQLAADELAESEPNNDTEHATEVEIPCRIRGAIERHGDTDVFRFQVDSKQTLVLDVSARSF